MLADFSFTLILLVHMKFKIKYSFKMVIAIMGFWYSLPGFSLVFPLPLDDVVGEIKTLVSKEGDTLAQIARDVDMGYMEMLEANPNIDPEHIAAGTVLVVPSQFILPNAPRDGIVVNLAEMRLYYYPKDKSTVITYPIGVGREGEGTLIGVFKIIQHRQNPTWTPTETMRKLRAAEGVQLPKFLPPGPDNPLGHYAMRLSKPTYLIHGTNDPLGGIGRRSSSGCMRLYPEDIEALFHVVPNGAKVYILDEAYKAGWRQNKLYIESHVALQQDAEKSIQNMDKIKNVVQLAIRGNQATVNWARVANISAEAQGIPQVVGGEQN